MGWPTTLARTKNWGTEVLTDTDLEGQLDLIIAWSNALANETSGHTHTGGTNDGPKIPLATSVSGTLPLANGGTGVTSLSALLNLVYPIGSVYINVSDNTNPGTLLGFGTWSALGAGRMIVGYDASDTAFDAAGETGGANTIDLSHTHTVTGDLDDGPGGNDGVAVGGNYDNTLAGTTSSSLSATQSVLNKYVTCYTWKRTA